MALNLRKTAILSLLVLLTISCDDENGTNKLEIPNTYSFERNGESSVSYSGQTDRLNQVREMKAYLQTGDAGASLQASVLTHMFANTNGDGNGNFSFSSSKQLENKAFLADIDWFYKLFAEAEAASQLAQDASSGNAGYLMRSGNKQILVNAKGHEFTQMIEKGLMGSVFLNQIYNSYLTDAKIGEGVDNVNLVEDKNYTAMEHHWDEAFGYFGVATDFPSTIPSDFWGKYCNSRDELMDTNAIMAAYLAGRTAIVNQESALKNENRDLLYELHEIIAASTAIHYINTAKSAFSANETADAFHSLSEAYAFVSALKYSPYKRISDADIAAILTAHLGQDGDFWQATSSGLNDAISTLVVAYPEFSEIKDQL